MSHVTGKIEDTLEEGHASIPRFILLPERDQD